MTGEPPDQGMLRRADADGIPCFVRRVLRAYRP